MLRNHFHINAPFRRRTADQTEEFIPAVDFRPDLKPVNLYVSRDRRIVGIQVDRVFRRGE